MDERVLGEMPSEGSESGRRFGIFRTHSPDPKMHSISRVRAVFVATIAAIVAFAVFFPMIQYASRVSKKTVPLPYPEIANLSFPGDRSSNCSYKVFSFGHDCAEVVPTSTEQTTTYKNIDIPSGEYTTVAEEVTGKSENYDLGVHPKPDVLDDPRNFPFQRIGRSGWPAVSTPYPYVKKESHQIADRSAEEIILQQTNIFAIPMDMTNESVVNFPTRRINFTPPPYSFTPFPNFTDGYAQLSPYKVPKDSSNFEEVMKYLKDNGSPIEKMPTEEAENRLGNELKRMKVSGTYVMPLDKGRPGEIVLSSLASSEDARPFFNGHAYVTDPFLKFRPPNPNEVNRLLPSGSAVGAGQRLRQSISFVPTSSVDIYESPSTEQPEPSGTHTVAIFHPPNSEIPGLNFQGIPRFPRRPYQLKPTADPPKDKPLSVTLDIYPVTIDTAESGVVETTSVPVGRDRGRLKPKWRPRPTDRPRWRPPTRPTRKSLSFSTDRPTETDNHMIVHLNLFPKKRKPYSYLSRSQGEISTESKSTLLSGGRFESRSFSEHGEKGNNSKEDKAEITSSTETIIVDKPKQSAINSTTGVDEEFRNSNANLSETK